VELNKNYGVYLDIKNIEDKDEKYEFNELLDVLITGESLHKDIDGDIILTLKKNISKKDVEFLLIWLHLV
jgi:hypothetical protein